MGILRLGSGGGLALALVMNIFAISTPGWIYTATTASGLFYARIGDRNIQITNKSDAQKVCIAFSIMGDAVLLCAAAAAIYSGTKKDDNLIGRVAGILAFVAGIFIMIGMASFTGLNADVVSIPGVDWGYSFAFAWLSFCIVMIGGAVALVGK